MQIHDVARRLGVSPRTIRHYEVAGLLQPDRSANGYRRFSDTDVRRAEWIRDLIAAGFSTREIGRLAACLDDGNASDGTACAAALHNKLVQIDRTLELLKQRREAVAGRLAALESQARTRPARRSLSAGGHWRRS
jgi:DNA-binding transcriptional MerR regulator